MIENNKEDDAIPHSALAEENQLRTTIVTAGILLFLVGSFGHAQDRKSPSPPQTASETAITTTETKADQVTQATPVSLRDGVARLSPANTQIEFVGTHEGAKPDPRIGGFRKFTGKLTMDSDTQSIESLSLDINTTSIFTEIGTKLTDHLKSPDFLDVKKFPKAKFVSTEIGQPNEAGAIEITGNFTLMGETKEIVLPAKLTTTDDGVTLQSEFQIDRTNFGMGKMTEKVSKAVTIRLSVGEKNQTDQGQLQSKTDRNVKSSGMQTRDRRQGAFDPDAIFKRWDKDKDGKLTGNEIPTRMQERSQIYDQNGDGNITLEEWQKSVRAPGGRR